MNGKVSFGWGVGGFPPRMLARNDHQDDINTCCFFCCGVKPTKIVWGGNKNSNNFWSSTENFPGFFMFFTSSYWLLSKTQPFDLAHWVGCSEHIKSTHPWIWFPKYRVAPNYGAPFLIGLYNRSYPFIMTFTQKSLLSIWWSQVCQCINSNDIATLAFHSFQYSSHGFFSSIFNARPNTTYTQFF